MPDPTLTEQIVEAAQKPKKVVVDGTVTEQHSLSEMIELDHHNRRVNAAKTGLGQFMRGRFKPGGTQS